jgi:cyclopropane-fatty-acyl-phospholipid synthase
MFKEKITQLLKKAGIEINGKNPWDVQVHDERLYRRIALGGTVALGESYMDGWWDVKDLDQFFYRVLKAKLDKDTLFVWQILLYYVKAAVLNLQSVSRAFIVGEQHYDIGNDIYKEMLDANLVYSCGYWKHAKNLDEAQEAKLDLICKKIGLKKGDTILDIGCGWGGLLKYAAEKYGAKGVGVTVSKEQAHLAREWCKGLPIEIKVQDYRTLTGKFDHIVSVGMFEHVGPKNYEVFMKKANHLLKDDGLFLLHTIGSANEVPVDPWIEKYIFPNGYIPSVRQISTAAKGLFVMEDWHNFGAYYDTTLMAWFENFDRAWPKLKGKYGERFYRMWKYYLLSCAGGFRARDIQLWQVVLSKNGVPGGYHSVR